MMLNILPLPVNDILLYLNLLFIAMILIGGFIGFIRGTRKSLVHLISWVVLFIIGILLMKPILKMILNYDLSSFGWSVSGININTLNQFLQDFLVTTYPDLFTPEILVEGTNVYALLVGIINFVYKIVYWLVWLILSMIFTRLINFIVWIFVKPKKVIIRGKKRRPRKTIGTRFGGLGIGAFRGLLCTLLIGFILAGVSSIASSINTISFDESDLTVVCVDDNIVLLSNSSSTNDIDSYIDEYSEIIDLLEGYRSTVPGKIFGVLKFGEEKTPVDEQLFDYFFSIESNTGSLRIRAELVKVANVLKNDALKTLLANGFDLETIASLDHDSLVELIDIISSLDTIKVVVPIGLDLIMYTDILANQLGNEFGDIKQALVDNIEKFNNINYGNDIQKLGYALVDIVDLFASGITDITTVNFLELDVQKVEKIFNDLSEMQLLDLVAPIAVTYLLSTEGVKNAIAEAGFTLEDLKIEELLKEKEDLFSHELKMIPKIYKALVATGISYNEETISFENINPDKIEGFVNALFDSYIIDNSISVVASTLYTSFMPDEYKDIISLEELKSTNWKEEFSPLLTAAAILLQYNIIDSEDPLETLSAIEDEDFEKIGSYLSKSNLIFGHMNEIIDLVIDSLEIEGLEVSSLDSELGETWSEKEVVSIFKAVKVIVKSGILTSEDPLESIKALSNETIDELATALSESRFFSKNINGLVDFLISQVDLGDMKLEGLDESKGEKWDETELKAILHSLKTIVDSGILTSDDPMKSLQDLSTESVDKLAVDLSKSKFFTKNLGSLVDYLISQADLGDIEFVGLDESKGEEWNETELKAILHSLKTIVDSGILTSEDPLESMKSLSNETIDELALNLSSSVFFTKNLGSLVDYLISQADLGDIEFVSLDESKGEEWNETELKAILHSLKTIVDSGILTSEDPLESMKSLSNETIDELALNLSSSVFFTKNLGSVVNQLMSSLSADITLIGLDESKGEEWDYLEINSLLKTIKVFADINILCDNPLESIKTMKDSTIQELAENISNSNYITNNLNSLLDGFDDELGITIENLAKEDWTKNETYSVFKSITIIASMVDGDTVSIENFLNLSEKDLDIILESKLLRNSLKSLLVDKAKEGGELELLKGVYEDETYYTWDDQVDKAISTINNGTLQITKVIGARKYIIYKNGIYFTSVSDNSPIDLQAIEGYDYSTLDEFNVVAIKTYGELRCVFNAITCLEINDVENFDIDLRNVINKKDTLFESYILVETLIDQIRKLSKDNPDGMLIIPEEFKENGTGNWRDSDGNVGELSKIINALDIVLVISTSTDPVLISTINTDNISLKTIVEQKDDILTSSIISYTIVDLFQESTSNSEIVLPSEYSSDDYSPWLDNGDIKGELSIIFDIINEVVELPDSGFEIDVETISMKNIIANKDNILKSAVLTATLVNIINDLGTDSGSGSAILTIPDDLKISETNSWQTDYNKWKNIYNADGTVKQAGELSKLINSLDLALGITTNGLEIDITSISEEDISLKRIVDNRTEVFESDILTVTVVELIKSINTAEEPNNIIIPIEYQNNYEVWRGSDGELCVILETLDIIGLIPATGIDVDVSSINISSLMTNKEKLITSAILSATIADKIIGMSDVLSIPDDYIINTSNPSWENDYNKWKGQDGELYKIISGLEYALIDTNINVDSIDLNNISLKNIINNKENVFKSVILTNTVIDSIKDLSSSGTIIVPVELNENAEWIGDDKELFNILDAIDAMNIIPTNGFNIDVNTLTINSILGHTDTILKSIILSATIINMINDLDTVITIPSEYQINNPSPSWENDYKEWRTKDELKKFINAISFALTDNETKVTELTMDTISLSNIIDKRNEVFESNILTATVVSEIQKLDGTVTIPSDYKGSYKDWQGVNGELDLLLAGLNCVVDIPETGFNISTNNIELNNIIIKSDEILKSAILTATIVDQIVALDTTLTIPNDYKINNTKTWDDYEVWKNKYDIDMNVTSRGELSNMLGSIDCILGISTDVSPVTINSLSSKLADFTIKGIVDQRLQILKSYVISATIIDKIDALDGSGVYIPSQYKITQPSDYDKWMNDYSSDVVVEGELSRVLVSVNALIGADDTSTSISDINIGNSINGMIKSINSDTSKQYRNALLGSNIVSETIITNISTFQSVEDYIDTAETTQKSFGNNISLSDSNNRSDWYLIEASGNIQEKELWNILTSVSLLLGSAVDFSSVNDFSIDDLISSKMKITYDDNYDVISSDVETLLKSYIIEHIFAQLTETLLSDTFNGLISFGGFNYYSNDPKVKAGDEYDLRTFLESFYIMNKYIDYSSITSSFDNLDVLANDDEKLNDLAAGMVISRAFRNSLASMYDAIFAAYYASLLMKNPLLYVSHPISGMPKFDQTRFDVSDTLTKVDAHDNFVVDYKNIYSAYHELEG